MSINAVGGCCGIGEWSGISYSTPNGKPHDPKTMLLDALKPFTETMRFEYTYDDRGYSQLVKSVPINPPTYFGPRKAFLYFSAATSQIPIGQKLADYLTSNQLGKVVEVGERFNPLYDPKHNLKMWVWQVDDEALKKWYFDNYAEKVGGPEQAVEIPR